MTGAHGSPPLGSAARDATAAPWHGKHRAPSGCGQSCIDNRMICDRCHRCIIHQGHASNACNTG